MWAVHKRDRYQEGEMEQISLVVNRDPTNNRELPGKALQGNRTTILLCRVEPEAGPGQQEDRVESWTRGPHTRERDREEAELQRLEEGQQDSQQGGKGQLETGSGGKQGVADGSKYLCDRYFKMSFHKSRWKEKV